MSLAIELLDNGGSVLTQSPTRDNSMQTTDSEDTRKYCVYLITNMINGKQYAGRTCQKLSKRWISHKWNAKKGADLIFSRAIRKHGSDNFVVSVLRENLTQTEAGQEEMLAIRTFSLMDRNFGYNMTEGGEGSGVMGEEAKRRFLENHRCRRKDVSTEEVVRLYREGSTPSQIAKKFGIAPQSVRGRLIEAKEPRRGVKHPEICTEEIIRLYQEGMTTL